MRLDLVHDEMAVRLDAIAGLRVPPRGASKITPPAALFALPDPVTYDMSYQRGADDFTQEIVILVSKADDRASWYNVLPYMDGSGAQSVKAALDSTPTNPYESCSIVVVQSARLEDFSVSGVTYLGAVFTAMVSGPGA